MQFGRGLLIGNLCTVPVGRDEHAGFDLSETIENALGSEVGAGGGIHRAERRGGRPDKSREKTRSLTRRPDGPFSEMPAIRGLFAMTPCVQTR